MDEEAEASEGMTRQQRDIERLRNKVATGDNAAVPLLLEALQKAGLLSASTAKDAAFQYPHGTDLLWMAHYRREPDGGDMEGPTLKLSGTIEEAAAHAQEHAVENKSILQCLKRRF